jgi:hypothetical protein
MDFGRPAGQVGRDAYIYIYTVIPSMEMLEYRCIELYVH